jgi:NAD(P)-dependent dehydrogenase (short-subunit alcohol dehydrogenase family)
MDNHPPTFIVLGATGGIGSELCRHLTRDGATPVLAARDEGRLKKLAGELDAPYRVVDATDGGAVNDLFSTTAQENGTIAGAVNCVGSFLLKPAHMTSDEEFSRQISQNLTTAFNTVRAAAKHMPNGGSVVLLSSVAARVGLANHEAIAAAKAGVAGLALSAAASYVGRGLRFNVVSPGLVQTQMTENVTRSETARKASLDLHPLGRLGEPEDIAGAIAFLLGSESSWITGQILGVDGGLSTLRPPVRRPAKG